MEPAPMDLTPAPSSPGGASSAAAWANPSVEQNATDVKKFVDNNIINYICERYGGPQQYLIANINGADDMSRFSGWLYEKFPEKGDVLYSTEIPLTVINESEMAQSLPLVVHVGALGFQKCASTKPGPGREVFGELLEQYMTDGVVTASEPMIATGIVSSLEGDVTVTIPWSGTLVPFCIGWIKGLARSTTLLASLHRLWRLEVDIKDMNPRFYDSVLAIYIHNVTVPSKMDEALMTMKFSSRGSIRKKTNIIQTVMMIYRLYGHKKLKTIYPCIETLNSKNSGLS
jgi:hypothetical protein